MKILFVCRGNVGRSVMAEQLFRKLNKEKHEVASAGTKLSGPEQPLRELSLAEPVIKCLEEENIDVSGYIRKQLTPGMVEEADKIIVMAEPETIPEYLSNSDKVENWSVKDPKGSSLEFHREIRDKIKSLVLNKPSDYNKS